MRFSTLLFATATFAIARVSAQAIDTEDVPSSCQSACSPVVAASNACEEVEEDDENEGASDWVCVCASSGMQTAVPECLACVQGAGGSGEEDGGGESWIHIYCDGSGSRVN